MRTKYFEKSFNSRLVFLVLTSLLMACSNKVGSTGKSSKPNKVVSKPTGSSKCDLFYHNWTSKDMQMSINKAKQEDRFDLAQQMDTKIKSMTKKLVKRLGWKKMLIFWIKFRLYPSR